MPTVGDHCPHPASADGVVLGTRLLASNEAGIHPQYRNRVLAARESDTVYTDIFNKGWPNSHMRVLRNSTFDRWFEAGQAKPGERPGEKDIISHSCPKGPIERYSYRLPAPGMEGDLEAMAHYAGQSVGLVTQQQSVDEILRDVVDEAKPSKAFVVVTRGLGYSDAL